MSQTLTERYADKMAGVLSCYDRVVITGTLPTVCYAEEMTLYLVANGIRIFDYPAFAMPLRDCIRERAAGLTAEAGGHDRAHQQGAHSQGGRCRQAAGGAGDAPGLVHVISAMEACESYRPWHDKTTHNTFLPPDSGKCLHYYFLWPPVGKGFFRPDFFRPPAAVSCHRSALPRCFPSLANAASKHQAARS